MAPFYGVNQKGSVNMKQLVVTVRVDGRTLATYKKMPYGRWHEELFISGVLVFEDKGVPYSQLTRVIRGCDINGWNLKKEFIEV